MSPCIICISYALAGHESPSRERERESSEIYMYAYFWRNHELFTNTITPFGLSFHSEAPSAPFCFNRTQTRKKEFVNSSWFFNDAFLDFYCVTILRRIRTKIFKESRTIYELFENTGESGTCHLPHVLPTMVSPWAGRFARRRSSRVDFRRRRF